jgi:hypothetical protein
MNNEALPWEQPDWLKNVQGWIRISLEARDILQTGPIEQFHIRPWSTVLRVPTLNGLIYFKATAPSLAFEPALTDFLVKLRPDILPDLLAIDLQRGWMLMRDCGKPLREWIKAETSLERWRDILPLYVELQKELIPLTGQILALGVPDRRLETLPDQFEHLVADEKSLLIGQTGGLTSDEYKQLKSMGKTFQRMCNELVSFNIPATLHHDDFHDGNLFLQNEHVRFTDWGESAVTHPFFTLVVLLRGASNSLDLAADDPGLTQVRDWYLNQWIDYAPFAELQVMVRLAERIGLVNRAMTWHRVISRLPESLKFEYASAVPAYMQEFVNAK